MKSTGQVHKLKDGTEVTIRPLTPDDYEASLLFFRMLPEEDKIYLRLDVDDPDVVKLRLQGDELEHAFRIAALEGDRIVADGVIQWPRFGWMSHVGEIRTIVAKDFRRRGLAAILFRELFIHGVREGLEKIEARMMPDQVSARRCVERLGFKEEGLLPGFALDVNDKVHDLVIMSTDVEGF